MNAIQPTRRCCENNFYLAAAVGGTAIAWTYIHPNSALGYLSTVISGVASSQLAIRGLGYTKQCISSLYSRILPEQFVDPRLIAIARIYDNNEGGLEVSFAEIKQGDGNIELVPLHRRFIANELLQNRIYTRFPGTYENALLMIAQRADENRYGVLKRVLTHSGNKTGVTIHSFLSFLCTPNRHGEIPIYSLDCLSLYEAIGLIHENRVKVDLSLVDRNTGKTLLQKCLSESKYLKVAHKLLEIDPEGGIRHFSDVIQSGNKKFVDFIISHINQKGKVLSFKEKCLLRAFKGDCQFSDKEYASLSQTLQNQIFQVANSYNCYNLVKKLRPFHLGKYPVACCGPGIISMNMDAIEIRDVLLAFFQQKKEEGLLCTETEFNSLVQDQYIGKRQDIGRVLGRDFIEKVAKQYEITSVKVPKKMIVLSNSYCYPEDSSALVPFNVIVAKQSVSQNFGINVSGMTIWAERIEAVKKHVTKEQMQGLLKVIEITGFDDINLGNIMYGKNQLGEEAFYIIDTEFDNFREQPLFFKNIRCVFAFMKESDHRWLQDQIYLFCKRVAARKIEANDRRKKEVCLEKYGFFRRHSPFRFKLNKMIPEMKNDSKEEGLQGV